MRWLVVFFVAAALAACGGDAARIGGSKGLPCELLVVCGPQMMRGDLQDSVKAVTEADAPGLGSGENIFRVNVVGISNYTPTFWGMHSKVFFLIEQGCKPTVGVARDVKARPEIEVMVKAPDEDSMRRLIAEKKTLIQQTIMEFQVARLATLTQSKYSKRVSDDLRPLGYTAKMPTDMVATKRGKDFLWAGSNRAVRDINFLFYTLPWGGEDLADVPLYVQRRDSVVAANIPGSQPGQHMTTSRGQDGQPVVWPRMRQLDGRAVLEVRGLWELAGGFMGGPFVAVASIDTAARRVVVREGFVYNPDGQKRDLMRQVEGALRTVRKL